MDRAQSEYIHHLELQAVRTTLLEIPCVGGRGRAPLKNRTALLFRGRTKAKTAFCEQEQGPFNTRFTEHLCKLHVTGTCMDQTQENINPSHQLDEPQ